MARELVKAADQASDNGGHPAVGKSPEVRLILHQLLWVLYGVDVGVHDSTPVTCGCPILRDGHCGPVWDWDKDMKAVREKVAQEERERHVCGASGFAESGDDCPGCVKAGL